MVERYGYAGVAGAVAAEGFGVPAPGQTMLMAAALEAARGHLHIGLLLALAVLAAVAGNSLGYVIGKRGGWPLLRKLRVNEEREAKIAALFERFGGGFILLARFLDGPRQLNGIVAGVLEMRWWVFTTFNVLGALLWVGIWALGTYYLSEHLVAIEAVIRRVNPWAAGLVVIGLLATLAYLFVGRRRR
jgi:membrane protein DedA with SNARE-associated domain